MSFDRTTRALGANNKATPSPVRRAAALTVCASATDVDDAAMLLDMLGLDTEETGVTGLGSGSSWQ